MSWDIGTPNLGTFLDRRREEIGRIVRETAARQNANYLGSRSSPELDRDFSTTSQPSDSRRT